MNIIELKEDVKRDAEGIKCPGCGGYAPEVETTLEEMKKYGCGKGYRCCDRAFVCGLCGARIVGAAEAPEYIA